MKDLINYKQLLTNPAGRGSAHIARRDEIIENMRTRAAKAFLKMPMELSVYTEKDDYIFSFSIPSEEYNIYYDVVLVFTPLNNEAKQSKSISEYGIRFFSNSPNFVYTYCYVLERDKWLVDKLIGKLPKQALLDPPDVRNPSMTWGFEKSITFAALSMKEYNLTSKNEITKHIDGKVNWKALFKSIKTFDEKMVEYNKAKEKIVKNKKKEKEKEKVKQLKIKEAEAKKRANRRK
jgi:hypothetical protein